MGARDNIREFFVKNVGRVVSKNEIARVAGIYEWGRRVRELRDEEGMQILTHKDRADLKPGQYVLISLERSERKQKRVDPRLRARVLQRDGSTCQVCGAGPGDPDPTEPNRPVRLHVDHIDPEGASTEANLRVLCSACNQGRSNLVLQRSAINLLAAVRGSSVAEQAAAYEWLKRKFD